jgi:hypothetical protein
MMTYEPNVEKILFDSDDLSTYSQALEVLEYYFDIYKNMSLSNKIKVLYNDKPLIHQDAWNSLQTQIDPMNRKHKVGFHSYNSFYFNMCTHEWTVINPVDGKNYVIKMTEATS